MKERKNKQIKDQSHFFSSHWKPNTKKACLNQTSSFVFPLSPPSSSPLSLPLSIPRLLSPFSSFSNLFSYSPHLHFISSSSSPFFSSSSPFSTTTTTVTSTTTKSVKSPPSLAPPSLPPPPPPPYRLPNRNKIQDKMKIKPRE